jgi:hypothetical protein
MVMTVTSKVAYGARHDSFLPKGGMKRVHITKQNICP